MIQYVINIMCSAPAPGNSRLLTREIAVIICDGLLVWCRCCNRSHHVHRDLCMDVWNGEKGIVSERITCDDINGRNMYGLEKLYAMIDANGVTHWCKYCKAVHRITIDQCRALWR